MCQECLCVFTLDVTPDDVCVCKALASLDVVRPDVCVSFICASMCLPDVKNRKRKGKGG